MSRPPSTLSKMPPWIRWLFVFVAMVAIVVGLTVLGARVASNTRADQAQARQINAQAKLAAQANVAACRAIMYVNHYIDGLPGVLGDRVNPALVRDLTALGQRVTADTTICDVAARSVGHAIRPLHPHP